MAGNNNNDGSSALEQGEMVRVMMQHCREMKRQETCSRWITALLVLTLFAGFLWLQVSVPGTKGDAIQKGVPDGETQERSSGVSNPKHIRHRKPVNSIYMLTNHNQTLPAQQKGQYAVRWRTQQDPSNFKLRDNGTNVVIPATGWYLVSLRMTYRVPEKPRLCQDNSICYLTVYIKQYHAEYPGWREIIVGKETMHCVDNWRQAITLNRVIKLKISTMLKVTIAGDNRELISWDNHFEVTHL
ncbi:uncharacterized protein [Salminus brasiliensis]|uniref:uncharacterized protein n=1 Tax=Salminus brasiliensis TaxID=930266 RepID=UPI003B82E1C7